MTVSEEKIRDYNEIKFAASDCFIKEWDVVGFIDSGSYGSVYRAIKKENDEVRESAIKIIGPVEQDILLRFKNELDSMVTLRSHPNAVHIEDYDIISISRNYKTDYYLIIKMELLKPIPKTKWTEKEIIKLGDDMCNVLDYCHSQTPPILHCDIKPANILMDDEGNYKLGDFGETRRFRSSGTTTGVRGTPNFMAPEAFNAKFAISARSDLYSLGYTMYTLLNDGKVPFEERGKTEAARRKYLDVALPRLKKVSKGMNTILCRLCHLNADERYRSAKELAEVLKRPEKKQRETKSKLHAVRKFARGLSILSTIWLVAIAAVALVIGTMEFGRVIFDHGTVDTSQTEENAYNVSGGDLLTDQAGDAGDALQEDGYINAEAIDQYTDSFADQESQRLSNGGSEWLTAQRSIPALAAEAEKKIDEYAAKLGLNKGKGKTIVGTSEINDSVQSIMGDSSYTMDINPVFEDMYDSCYYLGATSYTFAWKYHGSSFNGGHTITYYDLDGNIIYEEEISTDNNTYYTEYLVTVTLWSDQ